MWNLKKNLRSFLENQQLICCGLNGSTKFKLSILKINHIIKFKHSALNRSSMNFSSLFLAGKTFSNVHEIHFKLAKKCPADSKYNVDS